MAQRNFEVIPGEKPARPAGFTAPTTSMDVPRPGAAKKKRKRRLMIIGGSVLGLVVVSVLVSRLKPAAPSVDRSSVWIDTVKRGPMLRQVRGLGTLVPEDIRWIAASKEGRVEKIVVRPGAHVEPGTLILELSSPELQQAALEAQSLYKTSEAELTTLRATLQRELLNQESTSAQVHSEYQQAKMEAETNENLKKNGLIAELAYKTSIIKRDELENRDKIEEKRLKFAQESIQPQLAAKQATVDQLKASAELASREVENLHVRAGMTGVLQQLPVEVGQRVTAGTNLARVADPTKLKAQIKIAETQAKDIQINQPASIDTRNGIVAGHVTRVDPAVEQGTVTVDVALDGKLPKGARPDLSVDGTIELERLNNVLYVGRPAFAQDGATVGVFKLTKNGEAVRTPVHFGRSSVNTIEILSGLNVGDQVILSDTSAYDSHDRIQLN
ncbi:MAG TPA: efflux RND transporter periplasmic adaptor subunit [Chthoniobacterales bacterium]